MWALADGDAVRMGRLREIDRWFPTAESLNKAAAMVRGKMDEEELPRCFPNYDVQPAMGVLLWAMLEAESPIPEQRFKWRVYRSLRYRQDPPPEEARVAVMGLPVPGSRAAPIEVVDNEVVPPRGRSRRTVTALPRRSPRFPRRSPRLLALSRAK